MLREKLQLHSLPLPTTARFEVFDKATSTLIFISPIGGGINGATGGCVPGGLNFFDFTVTMSDKKRSMKELVDNGL
jgi:hypothetical protein